VNYDLEMIEEMGFVNGIENYSRYFDGRSPGDPPFTLIDYYKSPYGSDWLLIIDESHMTIPQIRGMYNGDQSRKSTLIEHGFRLPAALDNRPLNFEEFTSRMPQTIYVSATPDSWELNLSKNSVRKSGLTAQSGITEQLIRPTGIIDPEIIIKPTNKMILDLTAEIIKRKKKKERVLVTTLTKRMAEDLAKYLQEKQYLKLSQFSDLKEKIEKYFVIENIYGTFASQSEIIPVLANDELKVFNKLKTYYDSNLLSIMLAPLHPIESRNCLWRLRIK